MARPRASKKTASRTSKKKSVRKAAPSGVRSSVAKKATTRTTTGKQSGANRFTYCFGASRTDGDGSMRALLGGKGANLAEMTSIGLPVPPGFTITTATCHRYYDEGRKLPKGLMEEVARSIAWLEKETGKKFGDVGDPLLVSVRSGAQLSMPGMMDTVLNLGLNDKSVKGLAKLTGVERFAWDAYRRLINMYGDVVMGVDHHHFERAFDTVKARYKAKTDNEVPAEGMRELCAEYKEVYRKHVGKPFPQDPMRQLKLAIEAVFRSWNAPKAISYRRINMIHGLPGTAVNVQSMVFGNMGDDSGTGVAFTRDPANGKNEFYGEFLVNAQGEDVVAGIRTPRHIAELPAWNRQIHKQLLDVRKKLEKHYRDVQDIEFTIERGTLYMLQTRNGKRTGAAAVKIACDMVREKLISRDEALLRVPADALTQLLLPSFDPEAKRHAEVLTTGLPASPGVAVGKPAFTADEAVTRSDAGEKVLLVRKETSPEDIEGMHSAQGILTSTGGMTSHAAVVARGWGKCCVAGAGAIEIDADRGEISVKGRKFGRNDVLSIDGSTGEVIVGEVRTAPPTFSSDFKTLMGWADARRRLRVRTNADTPEDARRAREFGAQGIGLCRTEHMFFEGKRIVAMREMILADTVKDREKALNLLLPFQRGDFEGIFEAMDGLPVTIRLLDPPLHEFLPHGEAAQQELALALGVPVSTVQRRVAALHEANPMLGHRGCRLAVTYPEVLRMQVRAIVEAMISCLGRGIKARPEIMIPLVGIDRELEMLRAQVLETIEEVRKARGHKGRLNIPVGTMIEIPRAALTADKVARHADFFSFGTNDLTQLTYGYSRDDINSFLPDYLRQGILTRDPFQTLDESGVGQLVQMACERGRAQTPTLKIGICGEHGGDPSSVDFCHRVGMEYVSCSPFRVPIARLAAAQAAIQG
ncbi:MAG: pyruvate, phosphate dikinase [Phycisphaeraceae bacterium]|nr:pyruvate, phosphate dikinase [Phycisphaeraceae bacterium]